MAKVPVLLSTDIKLPLEEVIAVAKEVHFDGIDYAASMRDLYRKPKKVIALCEEQQVKILSLHQPLFLTVLTPVRLYKRMMKLTTYFPDLRVSNQHLMGMLHPFRRGASSVLNFLKLAAGQHVPVAFESLPNHAASRYYPKVTVDPALFGEFCKKHNMLITFDTTHIAYNGYDVIEFFKQNYKRIKLVHLSDYAYQTRTQHLPLGLGDLPIEKLLTEMKKTRWDGIIIFEIKRYPGATSKNDKINYLKKSLQIVRKYV